MKLSALLVPMILLGACAENNQKEQDIYAVTDDQSYMAMKVKFGDDIKLVKQENGQSVFFAESHIVRDMSHSMHTVTNRCGGFFAFDDVDTALENVLPTDSDASFHNDNDYTITETDVVKSLTTNVNKEKIEGTIRHLTTFHNRYYRADSGTDSMNSIKETWERLNQRGEDFSVELYQHPSWSQPSVIATWTGSENPEDVVVLGGHGDSINIWSIRRQASRAPGADDNASGIASVTETLRVLMNSDYNPKKTIKFFAYAAEEVGLRGSKEIAKDFANDNVNVIAVMQLDMTNHRPEDNTFAFMRDYTNDKLTEFVQSLATEHLDIKWTDDKCGYGCSDHASWHSQGFPAVMPFESRFDAMNKKIHTKSDTIDNSDATATHASHFSKLAIAYLVEIAK